MVGSLAGAGFVDVLAARYPRFIAEPLHVLFVCSRNRWRSPTAEKLFSRRADIAVRSRGLAPSARRRLIDADLAWAALIFVMEDDHHLRVNARGRAEIP